MEEILERQFAYSRSSFCNIFYNYENSRGPQEKLSRTACCAGLI